MTVLRKIAKPEKCDKENREIYHFTAYLKMDRGHPLPEGIVLYPKAFQENRILVRRWNDLSTNEQETVMSMLRGLRK